jgi:hypothetical protein
MPYTKNTYDVTFKRLPVGVCQFVSVGGRHSADALRGMWKELYGDVYCSKNCKLKAEYQRRKARAEAKETNR